MRNFRKTIGYLLEDFDRYMHGSKNPFLFIGKMFHNPGMMFSLFYRTQRYLMYESNMIFKILGYILYPLYFFVTYYFLSYNIDPKVEIKGGLYVHNRDIVITDLCKIGKNFSIMGQTTIGLGLKSFGNIVIGDNVMVGVGAKIIASRDINIADDVIIGANAVVVKSLLVKNSVYGGIPAVFIKSNEK